MSPQLALFILAQLGLLGGGMAATRLFGGSKGQTPAWYDYSKWAREQEDQGFVPEVDWRHVGPGLGELPSKDKSRALGNRFRQMESDHNRMPKAKLFDRTKDWNDIEYPMLPGRPNGPMYEISPKNLDRDWKPQA